MSEYEIEMIRQEQELKNKQLQKQEEYEKIQAMTKEAEETIRSYQSKLNSQAPVQEPV